MKARLNYKFYTGSQSLYDVVKWLDGKKIVGIDTETTGLSFVNDRVVLLQVGDHTQQFLIDCRTVPKDQIQLVLDKLNTTQIFKVAHNAKFDYGMIRTSFGVDLPGWVCTMLGNELLVKGRLKAPSDFKSCVEKYLGEELSKEEQKSFIGMSDEPFTKEQLDYAALDVAFLIPLWEKIKPILVERNMESVATLEFEALRATAELSINGIFINQKLWLDLAEIAEKEMFKALKELDKFSTGHVPNDIFGNPLINYNSPTQLKPILSKITGIDLPGTGEPILKEYSHPAIDALLEYRGWAKLRSTYGVAFLDEYVDKVTGRIHPDFRQMGAQTGRMACKAPNLQNIPKQQIYRTPFQAQDPDWRIISADFSNQEIRLLIQLSEEPAMIQALKDEKDIHSMSASMLFGIPYEDFLVYDEAGKPIRDKNGDFKIKDEMKYKYRNPAKTITFGLIYGMGVKKLAVSLGISLDEAKQLRTKYFQTFPRIEILMNKLSKEARANKYALSPLDGRRRDLTHIDWDNQKHVGAAMNEAKNMPFQGCGASTTKRAMVRIKNRIDSEGIRGRIVNVVHDELLYEVHKDEADKLATIVKIEMCAAFNEYAPDVPMVVNPDIGTHWIH